MKEQIMKAIGSGFVFEPSDEILKKVDESNRGAAALVLQEMIEDGVRCEKIDDGTVVVRIGFMVLKFRPETFQPGEDDCDTESESFEPEIIIMEDLWV